MLQNHVSITNRFHEVLLLSLGGISNVVMLKMPEMVVVEVVGVCVSKREVVPQRCNSFTFFYIILSVYVSKISVGCCCCWCCCIIVMMTMMMKCKKQNVCVIRWAFFLVCCVCCDGVVSWVVCIFFGVSSKKFGNVQRSCQGNTTQHPIQRGDEFGQEGTIGVVKRIQNCRIMPAYTALMGPLSNSCALRSFLCCCCIHLALFLKPRIYAMTVH